MAAERKRYVIKDGDSDDDDDDDDIDYGEAVFPNGGGGNDGGVESNTNDAAVFSEWSQDEAGEAMRHAYQAVQHLALLALEEEKQLAAEEAQLAKGKKIVVE